MHLSRTTGLASCESGMCFGNQRAFRVLQSWSVRAKEEPGRMSTYPVHLA